jgi:hypothetical protein
VTNSRVTDTSGRNGVNHKSLKVLCGCAYAYQIGDRSYSRFGHDPAIVDANGVRRNAKAEQSMHVAKRNRVDLKRGVSMFACLPLCRGSRSLVEWSWHNDFELVDLNRKR